MRYWKPYLLICFVVWLPIRLHSQDAYHKIVNKAEQKIINADYADALNAYKELSKSDNLYAVDIHNALVCGVHLQDESAIQFFGEKLSEKNLPEKYFLDKSIFNDLKNKPFWKKLAAASQQGYENQLNKNKSFIDSLNAIIAKENEINTQRQEMLSRHNNQHTDSARYYETLMRSNEKRLYLLFDKNFFPGENLISQYLKNDTTLSYNPHFREVVVHTYQSPFDNIDTMFTPMLKKELSQRNIKPETFAVMQDMGNEGKREYYGTQHLYARFGKDMDVYARRFCYDDDTRRMQIESSRKNRGLCDLREFLNKINFVHSGKAQEKGFIIFGAVSSYPKMVFSEDAYVKVDF